MNALDIIIKKERKQRYKRLKKLFIARDMARKHLSKSIKVSDLDRYFGKDEHDYYFTGNLAKRIVDEHMKILGIIVRPPPPPSQRGRIKL